MRPAISLALVALACGGCGDSHQLRTSADAKRFLTAISRGGGLAGWRLASDANRSARRAWNERYSLQSVGGRLHAAGPETWSCDLAEGMAVTGGFGPFTYADRLAVTSDARYRGASHGAIDAPPRPLLFAPIPCSPRSAVHESR